MALPKLTTPTYELEIPSTDEKIKYRPFLVKEEKILMMAMESKSDSDITQAVKDIVLECTFNKVDISHMPMFETVHNPNAEHLSQNGINLPSGHNLTEDDINYICTFIKNILGSG